MIWIKSCAAASYAQAFATIPAPKNSWTGFYAGVHGGGGAKFEYDHLGFDSKNVLFTQSNFGTYTQSISADGINYLLH